MSNSNSNVQEVLPDTRSDLEKKAHEALHEAFERDAIMKQKPYLTTILLHHTIQQYSEDK